jgi:HTH-type transcriptional regulator / antitoxin HigA
MTEHRTPGQLLDELLRARGWTKRVLAVVIGMDEASVGKIVSGRKSVDAHLALVLGEVFGIEAERFVELQRSYDLAQARLVAKPDPGRERRAHLLGGLPVSDMIRRRWIDAEDVRDVAAVERSLAKFFGVASPSEIEVLPHAAKKTNVFGNATPVQLAWLYRVRQVATGMLVAKFSDVSARDAARRLMPLRANADDVRQVPRIMNEAGIRFVIVESLPSAKIDGVCMWLDGQPVIGLSMRHDRIDNFWFVLRHELEHVIQGHGRSAMMLDVELDGGSDLEPEEERVANEAAASFCVPPEMMAKFVARKSPFFADRDIMAFAHTIGVHPGLVAGQLQRRTGRYDRFRAHQVKVRSLVTPGSITDGWGDVAPVDP